MALRRPPTRIELKADDVEEYDKVWYMIFQFFYPWTCESGTEKFKSDVRSASTAHFIFSLGPFYLFQSAFNEIAEMLCSRLELLCRAISVF